MKAKQRSIRRGVNIFFFSGMSLGKVLRSKRSSGHAAAQLAAAKEKKPRLEEEDASILSGSLLQEKADAQLLQWLFKCHRFLRNVQPPFSLDKTFLEELLSPRYLNSSIAGVQQITGCLLSDLVRLHNSPADKMAETQLPFRRTRADDVLTCLVAPFVEVVRDGKPLKTCENIIERASVSRVFVHIIPSCKLPLDERLTYLFASVLHASGTPAPGASTSSTSSAITTTTASEMAKILNDVLLTTTAITREQLSPLLKVIVTASPALLRCAAANRARGGSGVETICPRANKEPSSRQSLGAIIAARVLLGQVDVIPPAISDFVTDMVKEGVSMLLSAKGTGNDKDASSQGLRDISRAMEFLVALTELHVDLVCQLVPSLEPYLQHLHDEVRLFLLRGFFTALGAHEAAIRVYRSTFNVLLERFEDTAHALRIEMLELSVEAVRSELARLGTTENLLISGEIVQHVEQRLVDVNAQVRRAAVIAYGRIVAAAPSLVKGERLQETLAPLIADKNFRVRQVAVEHLCIIYRRESYPWIPEAVLECPSWEGGVMLLETLFETMLPPPKVARETAPQGGAALTQSQLQGLQRKRRNIPIFDFEKETSHEPTYANCLAVLCGDMSPECFDRLLVFAGKKARVRLSVLRLFQLREEGRNIDLRSAEGQEVANKAHRILKFLVGISHSQHGEWNALFLAKDDRVSRAFINCCSEGVTRCATERERLIRGLEGRVDKHVLKFVQDSLSKQMMLPTEVEDVEELLARLGDICRLGRESKPPKPCASLQGKVNGLLRALLFCCRSTPAFLPACVGPLVELLEKACAGVTACATPSNVLLTLFCITDWARYVSQYGEKESKQAIFPGGGDTATVVRNCGLVKTLCTLCERPGGPLLNDVAPVMQGKVCKQAARCLIAIARIRGLEQFCKVGELANTLAHHIRHSAAEINNGAVCLLKALSVFIKDPCAQRSVKGGSLVPAVTNYLLVAARDKSSESETPHIKAKCLELPSMSLASAVVDAAAKCLSALSTYVPSEGDGSISTNEVLDTLLSAYKLVGGFDSQSIRACLRRRSINQQLLKLIVHPSSTIERALAVAVVLSAESETAVRRAIQHKVLRHVTNGRCDMRHVACLILTAISEETKSDYQQLRDVLCKVGNHLRSRQTQSGATLSSREALSCFLEYSIPFLVLFMAHHTFYESESDSHFIAYQRVWHLLFDELFRQSAQCASFVMELFSRIKQTDDKLDNHGSKKARLICDLGIRVMQECMGKKQINVEALRRYPGSIQLPGFFVKSEAGSEALNTVYLGSHVLIPSHVPFRVPTASPAATSPEEHRDATVSPALTVGDGDNEANEK